MRPGSSYPIGEGAPSSVIMALRGCRSSANQMVTCLEARDSGYDFVTTCSRCDYYLQNKALNQKALHLPRSQLSKMWQCTSLHRLGDLYHSSCMGTDYRPTMPNKSNSFICLDRSSASKPGPKRVRLFSPEPGEGPSRGDVAEVEQSPPDSGTLADLSIALECQTLKERNAILVQERDRALGERDEANRNRAEAVKERDAAIKQRDKAVIERDAANAGRYRATMDRDSALSNADKVTRAMDVLKARIATLEIQLEESKVTRNLEEKVRETLEQEKQDSSQLIASLAENVSRLQSRVSALETQSSRSSTVTVNYGNSMRYITLFTAKLFPDLVQKERENELFNVLYMNKKSFRKHVSTFMKDKLLPELKVEVCKEIKKYYAAWKFLAVMDGSNQSLNQVQCCNVYRCLL